MRQFLFIFWILIGFFVLYLFSLNVTQVVDVDLFFFEFKESNLVFVIFMTLFIGFLFGATTIFVRFKKENIMLKKQLKALQGKESSESIANSDNEDLKPDKQD